jgi:undecaprenyl-diphosphatase
VSNFVRTHTVRNALALVVLVVMFALAWRQHGVAATTVDPAPTAASIDSQPVATPDPAPVVGSADIAAVDIAKAKKELTVPKAIALGIVEGVTEFLPVSSTGHLLVAERLLHVGQKPETKDATDAYTVIIQLGAILAVLLISWRRITTIFQGLVGKSVDGRKLLIALVCAFVPTAVIALAVEKTIKKHFLKVPVVAAAWIVGAVLIIALAKKYRVAQTKGRALELLTPQHAAIIGVAQTIALWPGMSRSLITILAAVVLGYSLSAAVEFSFLLGLMTLGAASLKSIKDDGKLVLDTFGKVSPLIGIVVAGVCAAIAVKWMITYLNKRDLTVFAVYRILAGLLTFGLLATNVL